MKNYLIEELLQRADENLARDVEAEALRNDLEKKRFAQAAALREQEQKELQEQRAKHLTEQQRILELEEKNRALLVKTAYQAKEKLDEQKGKKKKVGKVDKDDDFIKDNEEDGVAGGVHDGTVRAAFGMDGVLHSHSDDNEDFQPAVDGEDDGGLASLDNPAAGAQSSNGELEDGQGADASMNEKKKHKKDKKAKKEDRQHRKLLKKAKRERKKLSKIGGDVDAEPAGGEDPALNGASNLKSDENDDHQVADSFKPQRAMAGSDKELQDDDDEPIGVGKKRRLKRAQVADDDDDETEQIGDGHDEKRQKTQNA